MKLVLKMPIISFATLILTVALSVDSIAQNTQPKADIPDAPKSQLLAMAGTGNSAIAPTASSSQASVPSSPGTAPRLTRSEAEQMAIKNNPQVSIARLIALAQHQAYRETRSAELPTANAAVTAVEAEEASRVSAGSLTASRLFEHAGAGGGF